MTRSKVARVDLLFQVEVTFGHQHGLAGHCRLLTGQIHLGPFHRQHKLLLVGRVHDVVAGLLLEAFSNHLAQGGVHIVAAELADALAGHFLEDAVVDPQNGDVQGATAKVVDQHGLVVLGVQAVADGGGSRLVDQGQHLHAGGPGAEFGGVAGQPLGVGGDGHHRLEEILAQDLLGVLLEQTEEHDGDLFGAQVLAHKRHTLGGPQDALDGADRPLLIEVFLGLLAESQGAVAAQGDDGRGPFLTFVVRHHLRLTILEVGHHRVAGAEVDPNVGHDKQTSL